MFGKLSTLFTANEDLFTKAQEEFVEHWGSVTECLTSQSVLSIGDVYDTSISVHMADMIYMIERDKIPDDSDYGPCVEFLLQHEVLATLQHYAQNDTPTGMRKLVLSFFSQLVQKLQRSVLPHLHVHKPLQDMICVCGGGKYPIDEINFITSVLGKFHEDPSLVNLFMNETKGKNGVVNYELRLVDALISLSHNKDDRVVKKSCESLLLCVAADSEYVIENVLSYTILVQDLVSRLCQRYNSFQSDPATLLTTHVTWTTQLELSIMADTADKTTALLLLWVDYLNTLASSSHPNFTNKLLRHFSKVFLYTHLLNDFKSAEALFAVKALAMCQKMLCIATSELLLVEVLKFLTDDPVICSLCSLLNNPSPRVVENVLLLFNEMFETHHSVVVETLVLRHTKRNVNVRSRLLLGKEGTPTLRRTISGDSGVEEMLSDEETSFIHMNTTLLSHFEQDQHSPSLVRKLSNMTSLSSEMTSLGSEVTSPSDLTSSSTTTTYSELTLAMSELAACSTTEESFQKPLSRDNIEQDTTTRDITMTTTLSNIGVDEHSDSKEDISESLIHFDYINLNDDTNTTAEPTTSNHPYAPPLEHPGTTTRRPSVSPLENNRTITLEHNRIGSPNHFKTVIVSHDHVEEVRKPGRDDKINIKLDQSVLKLLNVMPELSKPRMVGYPEYLHDAHIRAKECTLNYSWITTQHPLNQRDVCSGVGVFLDKIVSLVLNIPYQSYTVNMLLLSLLSEICHIPHDTVTLYLLDTELPTAPLYSNLLDIAQQFHDVFQVSPTLKEQLLTVPDAEMPDICRAAFLTEEFCKELAAITLVKSTS